MHVVLTHLGQESPLPHVVCWKWEGEREGGKMDKKGRVEGGGEVWRESMEGREGGGLVSARSPSNLKFKSKSKALEHLSEKWRWRHTAMSTRPAWHSDFCLIRVIVGTIISSLMEIESTRLDRNTISSSNTGRINFIKLSSSRRSYNWPTRMCALNPFKGCQLSDDVSSRLLCVCFFLWEFLKPSGLTNWPYILGHTNCGIFFWSPTSHEV